MEQLEDLDSGSSLPTHQYPDPDYAAYVTRYPWLGDESHTPFERRNPQQSSWPGGPSGNNNYDRSVARWIENRDLAGELEVFDRQTTHDSDYQASDASISDDENISDDDSMDSEGLDDVGESRYFQTAGQHQYVGSKNPVISQGTTRGRPRGQGRGGKGIKRGLRRPVEPTIEFKALHAQATLAFVENRYDDAEEFTLQALLINPEMFEAHNLLSEIHAARGDKDKALSAAWNGAHTRPRDLGMWSRIARLILDRDDTSKDSLRDAVYCYNRIITVDASNVDIRYQRAALNRELGYKKKAANEYEQLRKHLPHDTTVLRHLAEIYIELEDPNRALHHYRDTIFYLQSEEPEVVTTFTWSDVNIVTELYGFQQRYEEGLIELKSLARWLLGRKKDAYWETYNEDDREWDADDQPRRIEIPEYVPGEHDTSSYGDGLPLELRVKLGIFRLKSESGGLEEAINHFEWLDPEDHQNGAKLYDYPDLYREAASALHGMGYYHEALRYYEPLQQLSEYTHVSYFLEMGACYKAVDSRVEAEDCFNAVVEIDSRNLEARTLLAQMRRESGISNQAYRPDKTISVRQHKTKSSRRTEIKGAKKGEKATAPRSRSVTMLAPHPVPQSAKQQALHKEQAQEEDVHALFLRRQGFTEMVKRGDESCRAQWMAATKALIQVFRDSKVFYPVDKYHRFYGYSKEARTLAARPKREIDALVKKSISILETPEGDLIEVPDQYCDIKFHVWLDIFLEYAVKLGEAGDTRSAYEIIATAYNANVFFHSAESLFLIHVCWFTCALMGNDAETLCNIARWFMREYQFVTDGYRLFSALNRLCDSENSWFNCGPSQKYILRQLKAVDFSLIGEARRKSLFQERASYTTRDSNGNLIKADDMDVALLMLYGHILYAGKSYAYAVNYYLRALALDPANTTIKLSLGLGYLHHALKRQADNRHHILMQGLVFLLEYYDGRQQAISRSEKQEAEFNVGHAYHILGLTHLAIPYYERCLDISAAVQAESASCGGEDFATEAAIALQGFWAASGNLQKAREVTERWLVV